MLSAIDSPLVPGARPRNTMDKTIRIVAVRPFLLGGQRQEVGAELELAPPLAAELITMGKAARASAAPAGAPAAAAAVTQPAAKRAAKET